MRKEFVKAGELDTPIDIYYHTNSQNEYGEITQSKTLLKVVWAKIMPKSGKEDVEDSIIVARNNIDFLVRWDDDLELNSATKSPEEHFVVKYMNKYWNIKSMYYQGRGLGIIIKCYFTDNN